MAVGFIAFAAYRMYKISIKNTITYIIMLVGLFATYLLFKTPWVFPILIILGGVVTNFSDKRIPEKENIRPKQIKWTNIWLFVLLFIIVGFFSETARRHNWKNKRAFNLTENVYRFGSLVFGGGDVLMPMMYEQYVVREKNPIYDQRTIPDRMGIGKGNTGPCFFGSFLYRRNGFERRWKIYAIIRMCYWLHWNFSAECFAGIIFLPGLA